jgi:hypothetical protein
MTAILKLALVPLVVWAASLASRKGGHSAAGWITGLPLIAGPIFVFLAIDQGPVFTAQAALAALTVASASIAHCLAFALATRRIGWLGSLLAGWVTFFGIGFALMQFSFDVWTALALTLATLALVTWLMPKTRERAGPATIPRSEIVIRMLAAFALAGVIVLGAPILGPALSGLLLTFPVSGSIIPAFTRALHGPEATIRMLRGFVGGMIAFALFIFGIAFAMPMVGTWFAFGFAITAALAGYFAARRLTPTP